MTDHGFSLAPGYRIREFRIEKELGAGGFGVTYLAWDEDLERWVALKEYLPKEWGTRFSDGTVGPGFSSQAHYFQWGLTKFLEEARTLARLNHPQIVRVYQVIEVLGTAYMAMEYVEGRSLKTELESVGRLDEGRVRIVLDALMSGLETVHACGILHRDIKPANVILRADDNRPVLIDFGAARQNMGKESHSLLSAMTPPYAAVEQYETDGDQGPWTDIYAVGVLAYECLTGVRPAESVSRFRNDTTRPLAEVAPTVSPQLATLIEKALKVDERDRPQDIVSWRRMLDDASPSRLPSPSPEGAGGAGLPATHSTPGVDERKPQFGEPSSTGLAVVPGGEPMDDGVSDDSSDSLPSPSSDSVPSLPAADTERKPSWAGVTSRRRLAAGLGVAASVVGGLWFASVGRPGLGEATGSESETGNGGELFVPDPQPGPSPTGGGVIATRNGDEPSALNPQRDAQPTDDAGIATYSGDDPFVLDPQPDSSPTDDAAIATRNGGDPFALDPQPVPSPTDDAGTETGSGDDSFVADPQPETSLPDPSLANGPGALREDMSRPGQEENPQPQGQDEGELLSMEDPLAEEAADPSDDGEPDSILVEPDPGEEVPLARMEEEEPDSGVEESAPILVERDPGPVLPAPGTVFRDCAPGEACAFPLMVVLPPAERARAGPTEPLAVSVHEVTLEQWRACARDANSCDPRVLSREGNLHADGSGFPVVAVTWEDVSAYIGWLGRRTGQPYRLLSEAEWEYMARAGTETGRYWDSESELCRYANAWDVTAHESIESSTRAYVDCDDSYVNTAPVGSFAANSFGVHDALGNVEEWVENRVVRGGSWRDGPAQLGAERRSEFQLLRSSYVGFRVARTLR